MNSVMVISFCKIEDISCKFKRLYTLLYLSLCADMMIKKNYIEYRFQGDILSDTLFNVPLLATSGVKNHFVHQSEWRIPDKNPLVLM